MFYSQFILAKKGPLGTIWIAAHLERKLRKNQVSDTDIGVSVDSILFPEMPIALRLSSHLLLGVVRIYSKKVSYLFDDCSEALLKVKNAFRANAVDLPPEESTAPYHAITLPETFDLDDFELPDHENLQGSFVDHHVGAKDQITLQDTMEGVIYSTSEFGRDERFGDGEASHLDLNEEIVVEKAATAATTEIAGDTSNPNVDPDPQTSVQAKTPIKDDEIQDALSDDDGVDQMDDSDGYDDNDADYVPDEYAEGPSTPGLWEEPNLPKVLETSTCVDQQEPVLEPVNENLENVSQKVTDYVPHQLQKSTPMEDTSMIDFGSTHVTESNVGAGIFQKPDGHEGVKDTYYENAIHKEHGVQSFVTNVGNINDAYYPNTTQLASHENNTEPNVTSLHSLSEKSFNVSRDSTYLQGQGSHATNTFDLNLQEIQFTQSGHDEDQVSYNLSNQQQSYNLNQGNNTDGYIPHFPTQERFSDVTQQDTTNTYTPHFPERLQERFSDVSQGNVTNSYTSHFQATERLPAVQEKFSSVTQGSNSSGERLERFSDVTQENNTNTYASSERLLGVQERFSDVPQAYNTNSLLGVQERFTDVTQGNTHTSSERLFGVQERFSDLNQTYNTDTYTSQISGSNTLLGVQERFSDVPQGSNTSTHTSGERLLGVQERFSDLNQAYNSNSYTSQMPTPDSLLGVQERFPDVAQGNNTNTYTPHFQPAERLLAVQERFSDAVLRQHTPVQENISRGSTGHFASTGKKRSITEALRTQTINFGDPSGSLTTNTSAQSVPNNDDILSSILVGRSSVMQVEPTPATKRRRQTLPKPPKTGVPKRKVPMDESTVLHGDMIRQQLTDTSDIRRPRKKVSCTWVELSLIHKQLWEDGIFRESLLTGVSVKLASLHSRSYDLRKIRVSRIESSSDAPALKSISQNDENAPEENLHDEANKDVWVENNTTETDPNYNGSEEQTSEANEVREPIVDSETATIEKDGIQSDEKTDVPSVGMDSSIDINSQYIDNKNDEVKMDNEAKDEVVVVGPEVVTIDQEVEEIGKNKEETETLKPEEECNEKELVTNPEGSLGKEVEVDNTENVTPCSKDVISNDKEKSGHQDATNIEDDSDNDNDNDNNTFDDENLEYSPVQNNTDFLNFDDDDVDNDAEEADEDLSDTEAKRIDNSGWSSRTKAVGKYLQVMFDKEGEHGRTGLRMNSLLTGKTRKEASRMFFETLVLKTKDYIHVEQNEPFENIDILPRSKLLKSDF